MPFRAAVGAQTFEQVVDLPYLEAGGIAYGGDMRVVQTEGFAAGLAVEMAVQFVDAAGRSLRQMQYFVEPLPSSISCSRCRAAKSDSVRKTVDLSTLSNASSSSLILNVS